MCGARSLTSANGRAARAEPLRGSARTIWSCSDGGRERPAQAAELAGSPSRAMPADLVQASARGAPFDQAQSFTAAAVCLELIGSDYRTLTYSAAAPSMTPPVRAAAGAEPAPCLDRGSMT